jgi:mannose-1-phosphate guanylyltransferase
LSLVTGNPLLQDAIDRLRPIVKPANIFVLTNEGLIDSIAEILPDLPKKNILAEPRPAGTAAALTWAALEIERRAGENASMISIHADWAIGDDGRFREMLLAAETVALQTHRLVTVGVVPTRPDTGFGYIQPAELDSREASRVKRFVEKPDRKRAEEMRNDGYLWNSGIFVWRVGDFLTEVRTHTRELARALENTDRSDAAHFFSSIKNPISVDVGVLERSERVMVIPGEFGWDDIGTWTALRRVRSKDEFGNVTSGDVHLLDCSDNIVHSESGTVVMYGVDDLVVVKRDGLVLITTTERAADLKRLVESLPPQMREG